MSALVRPVQDRLELQRFVGRAVGAHVRVVAALAKRWFDSNHVATAGVAAARTEGCLVIVAAEGGRADRIERLLLDAGLLSFVQKDRPREERKDWIEARS